MNEQMNTFTARRHTTDGMSEMVACANCGVMIPAHAKFCGKCGQSNVPAPKVDVVDATPAVLPQESFCPKCGAKLASGAGFCSKCGMSLAGSNSIAPVAHQPVATGVDAQVMAASATQGVPGAQGSTAASAVNVTVNQASSPTVIVNQNTKSKATAIILALFLGGLGIDCFYVGNTGLGILALITFAISDILWIFAIGWVLWIGLGIWALIRAIMYACSDKPPFRNNVTVVK